MHLQWKDAGAMGTNAIVGGGVPQAAGFAWANRQAGTDAVAVTYFGDGAINIGSTLESFNLAAAWKLPVCFFVENNLYAVSTSVFEATGEPRLSGRGPGFNIASWKVKEGERFSAGDVLLEIETDKATMDVEAQDDGVMMKIMSADGAKAVQVGTRIAVLAEAGDDVAALEIPADENKQQKSTGSSEPASAAPATPARDLLVVMTAEPLPEAAVRPLRAGYARVVRVAAADAFDAMTTNRPYRASMSRDDAIAELYRCAGSQFDPVCVEALERSVDVIEGELASDFESAWWELQQAMADQSTAGRLEKVANSTHDMPWERTDAIVAAIREVLGG